MGGGNALNPKSNPIALAASLIMGPATHMWHKVTWGRCTHSTWAGFGLKNAVPAKRYQ
jgi:hypothetical protein